MAPLYLEPVAAGDDDGTVLRKLAAALGVDVQLADDSTILRLACAAAQGVVYPSS